MALAATAFVQVYYFRPLLLAPAVVALQVMAPKPGHCCLLSSERLLSVWQATTVPISPLCMRGHGPASVRNIRKQFGHSVSGAPGLRVDTAQSNSLDFLCLCCAWSSCG